MRTRSARVAFVLSLAALAAHGLGCGAAPVKEGRGARSHPKLQAPPKPDVAKAPAGPALLPSHVVARLDDENTAPYIARRGDEALLFFNARGHLFTRLCDEEGAPKAAEPVDVGMTQAEMPLAAIEAVFDGYLAAWVEVQRGNATLKALALDASGHAKGAPVALAQSADEVSWIEIIAGKNAALVVWEVPREDHFDVIAASITQGQTHAPAFVLAHDALGWDAVATERGGAIATVVVPATDTAAAKTEQGPLGRVLYTEFDLTGKLSPPVTVSPESTAQNDVVIARAGKNAVVAWTDVRDIDASVFVAAVSPGGNVVAPPKRATAPIGEQALVSLVSGKGDGARALLAWEDSMRVPAEGRLIHLANVGDDGALGKARATLSFSASGPPDITADGDGFAVMTLAPASQGPEPAPADTPIWPTFVRFDKDLGVRAAEPVRAEPFAANDGIPYLTRSLSCHGATCTTLASSSGAPSTLAMVGLPVRQSPWRAPASLDRADAPPYPRAVTALYDGDHLAKVASAASPDGGSLVGWVTYFIESTDAGGKPAKRDEPLATAFVRAVSPTGVPGKTTVLSSRALSIGGVALAQAPGGKAQESAMVWVAREKSEAQVLITKLGSSGEKLAQKALTTVTRKPNKDGVPSEVSDVAVAYAPATDPGKGSDDGWVVAWVDTRDGNAEVYAARVDRTLRKVVTDRRITDAPGDSAEVQIVVRGKETILVWSDARHNPDEGNGDIHAVRLDTRTLQKVGPEVRLFASAAHSRSPSASLAGDRVVVAWIEEANAEVKGDASEAGVRIATLDERGQLAGSPRLVHGEADSAATSVAITCSGARCRGVLTSAVRESMMLDAFELAPGAPPGPMKPLVGLTGGVSADVSPSFAGPSATSLFFGDDTASGAGRVRFMTIAWDDR